MPLPKRKATVKPRVQLHSDEVFSLKPIPKSLSSTKSTDVKVRKNLGYKSSTNAIDNSDSSNDSDLADAMLGKFKR